MLTAVGAFLWELRVALVESAFESQTLIYRPSQIYGKAEVISEWGYVWWYD